MEKWFYNGTFMKDGTPISVCARSEAEAAEFLKRGYSPLHPGEGHDAVDGRKGKKTRKRRLD